MSHLPPEVLYIGEGVKDLPSHRLLRFNGLARRAILTNTVFLVVSSPESGQGEAERRAALIEQLLLDRKVPPAKIWRWVYTFPATKVDIEKKADLPGIGEDQQLNHGVWIVHGWRANPNVQFLFIADPPTNTTEAEFITFWRKSLAALPEAEPYLSTTNAIRTVLEIDTLPITLLLDEQLVVRQAFVGSIEKRRLGTAIERLMKTLSTSEIDRKIN
jgi:hypothetical protein